MVGHVLVLVLVLVLDPERHSVTGSTGSARDVCVSTRLSAMPHPSSVR